MSGERKLIRVGTRNSQLAMIQTTKVIEWLKDVHPNLDFEVVSMTTTGDRILETALAKIGEKNLFTKELENALADGRVDIIVHSLKDLPTTLPPGMVIGAVCTRDDPRDAVVMHEKHHGTYKTLAQLPQDSVVGTSSLRRGAQLKRRYPHLKFENIRGNLNTRLKKLDGANTYDCIILAKAGLDRMKWQKRTSSVLEPTDGCMYAVCQGAMAVECREGDRSTYDALAAIHNYESTVQCVAERAFLRTLEGGCSVPIGVYTEFKDNKLSIHGGVYSIDGTECIERECSCDIIPAKKKQQQQADYTDSQSDQSPTETEVPMETETKGNESEKCGIFAAVISGHHPYDDIYAAHELGARLARELIEAGAMRIVQQAKDTIARDILASAAQKEAAIKAVSSGQSIAGVATS